MVCDIATLTDALLNSVLCVCLLRGHVHVFVFG